MRTLSLLFLLSGLAATAHEPEAQLPFERPHAHSVTEQQFHAGWESRYFSEGRDSLEGDSLFSSSYEFGWNHLTGGVWYGNSPDQDYDELQFTLAITQSVDDFEYYLAYTHLQFPYADLNDNEIGAGFGWSGIPHGIELTADAYYSFDAKGSFWEIALHRDFSISNDLNLHASSVLGFNQGYVSDGHDGANHFALRVGLERSLTQSLALTAHVAHSWALSKDATLPGDDALIDFFHGGIGLQWSF